MIMEESSKNKELVGKRDITTETGSARRYFAGFKVQEGGQSQEIRVVSSSHIKKRNEFSTTASKME